MGDPPVVLRRWASGRPRGVPHVEIACDESGFAGGNLVGGHAPVLAHASVRVDEATAAAVMAGLRERMDGGPRGELKAGALLRRPALAHDLLAAGGPLAGAARVHLVDTVYFALCRLADLLTAPEAGPMSPISSRPAPRGTDIPGRTPAARHAARVLHAHGPATYGPDRWRRFLTSASDLMRTNSRWTRPEPVAPFAAALDDLLTTPGEVADVLRPMRDRLPAAAAARAALKADPKLPTLLEPVVPALARAVALWAPAEGTLSVVHDDQSAVTPERIATIAAGTGLVEVTLVDSRTDPRVQVADLLAGLARRVAGDHLAGVTHLDDSLTALLRPIIDPGSTWADTGSWAALTGASTDEGGGDPVPSRPVPAA
ncbi:hypothetical protein ACIA5D_15725 [Actinoplanes sp. NPDC051513]|uniref:hypothetical protein n=1 Tax=Actinoplanes sp. NPDC051513 TaxID=3363908 RepID=UPI00378BBD32